MKKLIVLSTFLSLLSCKDTVKTTVHSEPVKDSIQTTSNQSSTVQVDKSAEEEIKKYIVTNYLQEGDLRAIETKDRKFRFQQIDLNNDGKMETFVSFSTPYFCGTGGCSALLLDDHFNPITKFTVTTPPFYIDKVQDSEWPVIYLQNGSQWKKLVYKAGKYPSNPSVAEDTKPVDISGMTQVLDPSKSDEYNF